MAARRAGRTETAVVYYARLDPQRIKIGFTSRLETRMRDMRVPLRNVLAIEPGGRELEKQRHEQFRSCRIARNLEEFHPVPELMGWIEQVRDQHGLPAFPPDTRSVTVRRQP